MFHTRTDTALSLIVIRHAHAYIGFPQFVADATHSTVCIDRGRYIVVTYIIGTEGIFRLQRYDLHSKELDHSYSPKLKFQFKKSSKQCSESMRD